jgi:hypothetical protein
LGEKCDVNLYNLNMGLKPQSTHQASQEVGSFSPPVNQGGHDLGSGGSNDQSRVSATRSQIDHGSDIFGKCGHEGQRMVNHLVQ